MRKRTADDCFWSCDGGPTLAAELELMAWFVEISSAVGDSKDSKSSGIGDGGASSMSGGGREAENTTAHEHTW